MPACRLIAVSSSASVSIIGDVVEESDGDLMGDGVNIASRLEGVAAPGAICLSEDAYRQVKARLDLSVSDLGNTQLKNIAEPIRIYSLQVGVSAKAGVDCVVEIGGPGTLANSIKSLAVGGHISLIGSSLSRSGIVLDPLLLGGRGMTLGSITVGSRADFEAMNRAIALHQLRPVIDQVFPF